jgi:hypothetical protein
MIRTSKFLMVAVVLNYAISSQAVLAENSIIPNSSNGNYVKVPQGPLDFGRETAQLYKTIDGLIVDSYKTEQQENGEVKITIGIYNPLVVSGLLKVINQDGTVEIPSEVKTKEGETIYYGTQQIDARPDAATNFASAGKAWIEDGVRMLTNKEGSSADIFRYTNADPRMGNKKQTFEITLKPGQTLEVTNRDAESLSLNYATAMLDIIFAMPGAKKIKEEVDPNDIKDFLKKFAKEIAKEGFSSALKSDENLFSQLTKGKSLTDLIDKPAYEKFLVKLSDFASKNGPGILGNPFMSKLSEGVELALVHAGLGPVGKLQAGVFKAIEVANPFVRFDQVGKLGKLPKTSGILISNVDGNIIYPTTASNAQESSKRNLSLMQGQLSSITQGGSSHIGSAAYYLGRSSNDDEQLTEDLLTAQGALKVQRFSGASMASIQQRAEYTSADSITNLKAPVDVVLNWNQSIAKGQLDLDAHLTGPAGLGADSSVRFHTRYDERGSLGVSPYVELYRDVIPANGDSGAEQTRIQQLQAQGIYRFYVHDFTNRNTIDSPALAQSEATVTVHNGILGPLPQNRNDLGSPIGGAMGVPLDGKGNVWYTFQLDSRTGILKRVFVPFGNVSDRAQVPSVGERPRTLVR